MCAVGRSPTISNRSNHESWMYSSHDIIIVIISDIYKMHYRTKYFDFTISINVLNQSELKTTKTKDTEKTEKSRSIKNQSTSHHIHQTSRFIGILESVHA